jgi:minor extracellular serine protease Vpr
MPHWVSRILVLLVFPLVLGGQERREAIVVLSDPSVIEQLVAEQPTEPAHRRRARLLSGEGEQRAMALRSRKALLAERVRQAGAELAGGTEYVLNSLVVRATPEELEVLRKLPGVQSAQFARQFRPLMNAAPQLVQAPEAWKLPEIGGEDNAGTGIKIAIIDSGIDQNHPMFRDLLLRPPAGFPKGDPALISAFTNGKVIVARDFTRDSTGADHEGHGTFNAGIAAGMRMPLPTSFAAQSGSPALSVVGMAPKAFLGNYRILPTSAAGGNGASAPGAMEQAIDAAVADGMDIINISFGESSPPAPEDDPDARILENARLAGVLVVASAGNDGPGARTISSPASLPSVLAVGSTTNADAFYATVVVSSSDPVPAALARLGGLPGSQPVLNSVFGPAPLADVSTLDPSGLACPPSSTTVNLPSGSLTGKIALIKRSQCNFVDKVRNVAAAGAVGAVIYNNVDGGPPVLMSTTGGRVPSMSIGNADGLALAAFLAAHSTRASFDPALMAFPNTPDILSSFSSRGPDGGAAQAIKPELVAPGELIVSATQNLDPNGDMYSPSSRYTISQGTSHSAPMVAGAAALVKQAHPSFSPDQIKSALVNTAVPVAGTEDGAPVSAQTVGAGRLNALAAVSTTVVVVPATLSFATHSPGSTFTQTQPLALYNVGKTADTFTLRVAPRSPHPAVIVDLSQTSVTLAPNQNTLPPISVRLHNIGPTQTVAEGMINISSQATGQSINVPYWVSFAMPQVNTGGTVSAASYHSAGGVAPGSIVSIFGIALSSVPVASASQAPLPTSLGGTTATFSGNLGGGRTQSVQLPLFYSSSSQVNAQIPFEALPGTTATLALSVDGQASTPITLQITSYNPGLFSRTQDGAGPGAILHSSSGVPVSADAPAQPGETVSLYATGLGAVNNGPATGAAATASPLSKTQATPLVTIGGLPAVVTYSGLAPGFVGLYQVNVTVPTGLATGDNTVVLNMGGASSNTVTLSVR